MAFAFACRVAADLQLMQLSVYSPVDDTSVAQSQTGCRTSVAGDACFEKVLWAMRMGIAENPDLYVPLTNRSSFEDFQRHLHGTPMLSTVCPEPCTEQWPEASQAARFRLQPPQDCRTSVEGDECFEKVVWAMRTGIVEHPGWYLPLNSSSSFEDFQRHLHSTARLSGVCPEPCADQALEISQSARSPAPEDCHTSVEGDACFEKVVWAMRTGIVENPDWYSGLHSSSTFEEFQLHLHGVARLSHVCPKPCLAREPAKRVRPQAKETQAQEPRYGQTPMPTALHVGTPMPTEIHEGDLLLDTYPGFEQVGRNCHCGEIIKDFSEEFDTLELCAYECGLYPHCKSIGIHPWDSIWRGHCALYKDACEDTNGHEPGTTCAHPVENGSISVNFNRVPTPVPTPLPTRPPDPCDVLDGTFTSSSYPCMCGSDTCLTNEVCNVDMCAPIQNLKVEWPCARPFIGSWYFSLWGVSATGAPVYSNADGTYIYWDASCDGQAQQPRWIFDEDAPNLSSLNDLDNDRECSYMGHHGTSEFHGVPLGNLTWFVACDGPQANVTVPITYVQTLPTPSPTLAPGKPCTCEQGKCGYFTYMDIDGDGCLLLPESEKVEQFKGHFDELDADGDGCLTQEECANSSLSNDLPPFPIPGPAECDYGFYFINGTSVCQECFTGATRRRRSEACTECPSGKEDLGEFDNCIGGVYMTGPVEAGSAMVFINKDVDESGVVLQKGDGITMSTRNPGHFERAIIADKVGFEDDARLSPAHESLLRTRGPFFVLDHGVHDQFNKFDAIVSACTAINGIDLSGMYPCGCGIEICEVGFKCDEECGDSNNTVLDGYAGTGFGTGGCCVGPPASPLPTPSPTVAARGDPHLVNLQGEHFDVNHGGEFVLLRIPQDTRSPAEVEVKATILPEHGKPCTTYITEVEISGAWLNGKVVQVRSYLRSHAQNTTDKFLGLRVLSDGAPVEDPWEKLDRWTDQAYVLARAPSKDAVGVTLSKTEWYSKKHAHRTGQWDGAASVAGQVEVRLKVGHSDESAMIVMRQDLPMQEHLNLAVRRLSALGRVDVGGLLGFDTHPESLESVTPECQRHRDGLDSSATGPRFSKPGWKTRWEKIREQREQAHIPGENTEDNEAGATLTTREKMCVCPIEDTSTGLGEGENVDGLDGGEGGRTDGVLADFQIGRLAEATWD